jgi:radical SAM superfamily enzyme YgiQ (UPF0313 family)
MSLRNKNILLVCPVFPPTYWGMRYTLETVFKKTAMPPLGLMTIAAMGPSDLNYRLIDLNCRPLADEDLHWADVVCFTAMLSQARSLVEVAGRAREAGKPVVAGGPYATACVEACRPICDAVVTNEGEITWPRFLEDLENGRLQEVYATDQKADLSRSPCPRFDLLNFADYASIGVQFSRGCPFHCEFCDVTALFGHEVRTKSPSQLIVEIDTIFRLGHRGAIFVADDNFIGDRGQAGRLLGELRSWNERNRHPFYYLTQASLNLAYDRAFLDQMVEADFKGVFLGIETPSIESLKETKKLQNIGRSLLDSVETIQKAGMVVHGGFIIGFDNDGEDIFDRQIEFIRQAAIPNAFIELLSAFPGTALYGRMKEEGRLKEWKEENLADGSTNIKTVLSERRLLEGYSRVLQTLYSPEAYFERTFRQFSRLPRPDSRKVRLENLLLLRPYTAGLFRPRGERRKRPRGSRFAPMRALGRFFKTLSPPYRAHALRFLIRILKKYPERLPGAILYVFTGAHFYRYTYDHLVPRIDGVLKGIPSDGVGPGNLPGTATTRLNRSANGSGSDTPGSTQTSSGCLRKLSR